MAKERRKHRKWSGEQKRQIVSEVGVDGASVSVVARCYDVNANLVFKWLRDPRYNPALQDCAIGEVGASTFLPVELYDTGASGLSSPHIAVDGAVSPSSGSGSIELRLAGGHCVSFPCDMAKESLLYLMRGMIA